MQLELFFGSFQEAYMNVSMKPPGVKLLKEELTTAVTYK